MIHTLHLECPQPVSESSGFPAATHVAYLGLGSNLGDKEENIRKAIALINEQIGTVVRQSALYYSEPWGFESDHQFVNAVICVHTAHSPRRLLKATQRIERQLGKTAAHATVRTPIPNSQFSHDPQAVANSSLFTLRSSQGRRPLYHDRPIDIDILLYDDLHIDEPDLKIPHPLMDERPFVTVPLSEIR